MGLRIRKRINLGGFRINISKSGIGHSYGVKGMRFTKKSTGGYRSTFSLPGSGISYVIDSKKRKKTNASQSSKTQQNKETFEKETLINTKVNATQNSISKRLSAKLLTKTILPVSFLLFVLFFLTATVLSADNNPYAIGFWVADIFLFVLLIISFILNRKIRIHYDYDKNSEILEHYQENIYNAAINIKKVQKLSQVFATNKSNGDIGATELPITIKDKTTYIKSNLPISQLSTKKSNLVFMPDFLYVSNTKTFYPIDYLSLTINYQDIDMPRNTVSDDTYVISQKYLHETKSGTPDGRYKNNPIFNICAYGGVSLETEDGLNVAILFSNRDKAREFASNLIDYQNYISSLID